MKVTWSPTSEERLAAIEEHVAQDNLHAAERLILKLTTAGNSLADHPRRGRPVRGLAGHRELVVGNYRLIYVVADGGVEIATIFEAHRRLRKSELE